MKFIFHDGNGNEAESRDIPLAALPPDSVLAVAARFPRAPEVAADAPYRLLMPDGTLPMHGVALVDELLWRVQVPLVLYDFFQVPRAPADLLHRCVRNAMRRWQWKNTLCIVHDAGCAPPEEIVFISAERYGTLGCVVNRGGDSVLGSAATLLKCLRVMSQSAPVLKTDSASLDATFSRWNVWGTRYKYCIRRFVRAQCTCIHVHVKSPTLNTFASVYRRRAVNPRY